MIRTPALVAALALSATAATASAQTATPTDAQIAHIAYTAGELDAAAGKQALAKSRNKAVRDFAQTMVRDHAAVNRQALALVKKLGVTPEANPISASLSADAAAKLKAYEVLDGAAFDRAYVQNEVAYHRSVNGALESTLIPNAKSGELRSLLQTGLTLFRQHQQHAEHLAAEVK